jgi:hypothetical protein
MVFMSFLHPRHPVIGALKSVRGDKHGQGTGREAETGRNKPAILPVPLPVPLPVRLSTGFGRRPSEFILNRR